jgi:tetratricopeptide (TPR) repeat protein
MVLRFSDGSTEFIGPNSQFHVVKVATPTDPKTILELNKGRMWSQSKVAPGGLEIRTGTALAAVRGTDWELVTDGEVTTLSVFSGEVEFSNEQGGVTVRPNEQARAEKGKAPVKLLLRTSRERIQWVSAFTVGPKRYPASDPRYTAIATLVHDGELGDAYNRSRALADASDAPAAAFLLLSDFEVYRGEFNAAMAVLERGARRFPQDGRFEAAAARLALFDGDIEKARTHARAALAQNPDSPDALVILGDIERHEGRGPEAIAAYGRAVEVSAGDARAWYGRGAVQGERENVGAARADLSRAIALDGTAATYRAESGTVESFANNLDRARTELNAALDLQPDNYVALTGLGIVELKAGNVDAALAALQKAGAIEPRYARAHVYLAAAYYQQRKDSAALFELSRAKELDPNDPLPYLLTSLIHLDRLEPVAATEQAQEALKRIPYLKSLNEVADNQKGVANVGTPLATTGLEYWARSAAYESYLPTWGGSHLFLADRYPGDFDKRSELMQGFVTDPSSFGASNRFQSLITQPGNFGTASLRYNHSKDLHLVEPVITVNGNDSSNVPVSYFGEAVDTVIDPGNTAISARAHTYTGAVGMKPRYDISTFVYANYLSVNADLGTQGVVGEFDHINGSAWRVDGGVRYAPDARSSLWIKAGGSSQDSTSDDTFTVPYIIGPSPTTVFQASHFTLKPTAADVAARYTFLASERLELNLGAESAHTKNVEVLIQDILPHDAATPVLQDRLDETDRDRSDSIYAMGRWLGPTVRFEAGVAWMDYQRDRDLLVTRDPSRGGVTPLGESYRVKKTAGLGGVVWRIDESLLARGACRRWVRPTSLDTLAPVAVAGMALDDQLVYPGGLLDQCRAQIEWNDGGRTFATAFYERSRVKNLVSPLDGVQNTASDITNLDRLRNRAIAPPPTPDLLEAQPVFGEGEVKRATVALDRILNSVVTLRAYYTYSDSEVTGPGIPPGALIPYIPRNQVNLGAVLSPGWHSQFSVYAVYRSERFTDQFNNPDFALPASWDAQVDFYIESADKHWSLEAYASNLLKKPHVSDVLGAIVSYRF